VLGVLQFAVAANPCGTKAAFARSPFVTKQIDCLIIGGGPAGLTAAIYLSRFHLNVKLVDDGNSRALWIPCTHNHAGFPGGISGADLLDRMRQQARSYGAKLARGKVSRLSQCEAGFEFEYGEGSAITKTVVLATGVQNRRPHISEVLHAEALEKGLIRYCPVCDGYEITDKDIAVIGTGERGTDEAIFLRGFTKNITLIAPGGQHELSAVERNKMSEYGIACVNGPTLILGMDGGKLLVETAKGILRFDSAYPALGSDINSSLAQSVGAELGEAGCITVDNHQRTSVEGLYAAGDVVVGLDQISHAMGEGGVAAVTVRNDLAERTPVLR
jgi:thioredoxin reductase (NADPH)